MDQSFDRRRFLRSAVALGGAIGASFVPAVHGAPSGRALIGFQIRNAALIETILAGLHGVYQPDLGLKPVIIPGGSGAMAVDATLKAPPDGSTALILPSSVLTLLPLTRSLTDEPTTHLLPVAGIGELCLAFIVGPAVPTTVRSISDYVEWVRANPQFSSYGVPGFGTGPYLIGKDVGRAAGLPLKAVAYKGMQSLSADVAAGTIAAAITTMPDVDAATAMPTVRVLAVTSDRRWPGFPDVPTLIEARLTDTALIESLGFFVAAGTPTSKVDELAAAVKAVASTPPMQKAMAHINMRPMPDTSASYAQLLAAERGTWLDLARRADNAGRA